MMRPTAPAQYVDSSALRIPQVDEVTAGVWSIPLSMPDRHNPYSVCYAFAASDGSIHLLDPGFDTDANWHALTTALASFGATPEKVASVFSTHAHPDHVGLADRVRRRSGARVLLPRREHDSIRQQIDNPLDLGATLLEWGVPGGRGLEFARFSAPASPEGDRPDGLLDDGAHWDVPGRDLRLLATPGHTPGHACVVDTASGTVFSGDHVLPNVFPGVGLGGPTETNPIADYLASTDRLAPYKELQAAPGHGYRFTGLLERAQEIGAHHLVRSRETARILARQPEATVWEIASQLHWTAGWDNLSGVYLFSALNQTELHRSFVRSSAFEA